MKTDRRPNRKWTIEALRKCCGPARRTCNRQPYLPYSTPLWNRFGAVLGWFCRLRRETSISQNWLKGLNMATMSTSRDELDMYSAVAVHNVAVLLIVMITATVIGMSQRSVKMQTSSLSWSAGERLRTLRVRCLFHFGRIDVCFTSEGFWHIMPHVPRAQRESACRTPERNLLTLLANPDTNTSTNTY